MEKIVDTAAVNIVLTRLAIDFKEFVSLVVKLGIMDKDVSKVFLFIEYFLESNLPFIY